MSELHDIAKCAREASYVMASLSSDVKNQALLKSDLETSIKGKQLNMEGEIEANLKAALCKIN